VNPQSKAADFVLQRVPVSKSLTIPMVSYHVQDFFCRVRDIDDTALKKKALPHSQKGFFF